MITINGAKGEGGGQVLRSSLALAMVTGQPFRIENIRAGRARPGLMRQHLTSVTAASEVCSASVTGASLGSTELEFHPGRVRGGDYRFAIGTAGSTTLVLQTVLPALMTAPEPSSIEITGGTHNTHAPSVELLRRAFVPLIERMGPAISIDLERFGFYPAGGGCIRVRIDPTERLEPFEILEAGEVIEREAIATIAGLPGSIGTRELDVLREQLGWPEACLRIEQIDNGAGPGNVVTVVIRRSEVTEVFTGFGERGVSAERVASNAAREVGRYLASGVPVWGHLADQLMLPMALSGGGSFVTGGLSLHATTNADVIESFTDVRVHREDLGSGRWKVSIL